MEMAFHQIDIGKPAAPALNEGTNWLEYPTQDPSMLQGPCRRRYGIKVVFAGNKAPVQDGTGSSRYTVLTVSAYSLKD